MPVIAEHDGPGGRPYTLFETGAILLYLAEKTGQLLPKDPVAKFDAIQWVMVQMTLVGPMFGQYVHFMRFGPQGERLRARPLSHAGPQSARHPRSRLGVVPFLGGQSYSIADIATFPGARGSAHFSARPPEPNTQS